LDIIKCIFLSITLKNFSGLHASVGALVPLVGDRMGVRSKKKFCCRFPKVCIFTDNYRS